MLNSAFSDDEFARLVDKSTVKINPLIGNGLATTLIPRAADYIEKAFQSVKSDFPACVIYGGGSRCTPQESFDEKTRKRQNKAGKQGSRRSYDISPSDLYMMKYRFHYWDGKNKIELDPRYILLPDIRDGGIMQLSGSMWVVSAVLIDRVISVGLSNVFVQLNKTRFIFKRLPHRLMIDGVEEPVQVIWAKVHQGNRTQKASRAVTTMMHYLLCKYGFAETFALFGNCHPVILTPDTDMSFFPENEWAVVQSSSVRLKKAGRAHYERSHVRLAVRRSELNQKVISMLGGLFYVVDHFPLRALPENLNSKRMWTILLGELIPGESDHAGVLFEEAEKHLRSLDKYIDMLTDERLRNIGMPVKNIYELFSIIIGKFNEWLLSGSERVASMYDKEFSILPFVLYNIVSAINNLYFRLKAAEEKAAKAGKVLTPENINGITFDLLKTGLIFNINKGHGEVSTLSAPGDNKAFKTTVILVSQTNSNNQSSSRDRSGTKDPTRWVHASIVEVGSAWALKKSDPFGKAFANPTVEMDHNWVVKRKLEHVELLDSVQNKIRRR